MKKTAIFFATILLSAPLFASGAADYMLKHIYDNFGKISNLEVSSEVRLVFKNGKDEKRETRKYFHYISGNSCARIDNLSLDEKTVFYNGKLYVLKQGKLGTLPAPVFNRDMFYPEPAFIFDLKNYFKGFECKADKTGKSITIKSYSVKDEYPRIVLKIHEDTKMMDQLDFFDKNGVLYTKITFINYKNISGVLFPQKISVEIFGIKPVKKEIEFMRVEINHEMGENIFKLQ